MTEMHGWITLRKTYKLDDDDNDEDSVNHNNFIVHRLARGKVEVYQDGMLSPRIPTIEDGVIFYY